MANEGGKTDGGEVVVLNGPHELMGIAPLPEKYDGPTMQPTAAMFAAMNSVALGVPEMSKALARAMDSGGGLQVVFSNEVTKGLRDGSLKLLQAKDGSGALATAVNSSSGFVENGRVVGTAAAAGAGAAGGVALGAVAVAALPVVIAGAAAYAQQQQLERSLASIKAVVERIEARLEDSDAGVADAAELFLDLVTDTLTDGGLTPYLQLELAAQRSAVEALYQSRRRWVARFKSDLEREQIEREQSKGPGQPWVDVAVEAVKDGKLEKELILFVRLLLSRSKLGVLAASVLAEEGRGGAAMALIENLETDLRREFFDLHNRLGSLARFAPDPSLKQRLPGFRASLQRAHETVVVLVDHLNQHVLPVIPDPASDREVVAVLSPDTVRALAAVA